MFHFTRRRVFCSFIVVLTAYMVVLVMMHTALSGGPLLFLFRTKLNAAQLRQLMLPVAVDSDNFSIYDDPLMRLVDPSGKAFHFFDLPKRKGAVLYGEVRCSVNYVRNKVWQTCISITAF
jgi:hypothetical protein